MRGSRVHPGDIQSFEKYRCRISKDWTAMLVVTVIELMLSGGRGQAVISCERMYDKCRGDYSRTALNMAMMFSGGTLPMMLCT